MNIILSNSSSNPIYLQIVEQIKKQILAGELKENDPLPSIRSLAKELQISVITTKRAYKELENEGFIDTVGGKGSFIAAKNKDLLKEKKLEKIEEMFIQIIEDSKILDLSLEELQEMLTILYEEV